MLYSYIYRQADGISTLPELLWNALCAFEAAVLKIIVPLLPHPKCTKT